MICVRSSLYCSSAALAARGSAFPSRAARWINIWVLNAAPLAQCLRDLQDQTEKEGNQQPHYVNANVLLHLVLFSLPCNYFLHSFTPSYCSTAWYHPLLSPGVTVSPQQTGLQLGESEAELGLKSDRVLNQLVFVAQVSPTALQVLLHHLLELPDSLLEVETHAWKL